MDDAEITNPIGTPLDATGFINAGLNVVAYVRPITTPEGSGFAIHAANGERYGIAPNMAAAYGFIKQNDMEPISLH